MTHTAYYAVAAAAIPLLLIAATLQARFLRANNNLIEWDLQRVRRYHPDQTSEQEEHQRRTIRILLAVLALIVIAVVFAAELVAITNLNDLSDSLFDREFIMLALFLLAIVVGIGLSVEILSAIFTSPEQNESR